MSRLDVLKVRWAATAPRERRLVTGALALVALALLWWIALAPALRTLAAAPAEHARLDAQLQRMATLRAQAQALQAQPRTSRDDALGALEAASRQSLGASAQLLAAGGGEGVGITLRAAPADALAQWLAQARGNAHAVPREAHLTRAQGSAAAAPGAAGVTTAADARPGPPQVRWDGALVMGLPAGR